MYLEKKNPFDKLNVFKCSVFVQKCIAFVFVFLQTKFCMNFGLPAGGS